ncbi:MAG: nucleotide sugar dehydrogenase, partial [Ignavibacteriaceae bacterium]
MKIIEKIKNKTAVVGIVGMGYVGLPLGLAFAKKKINVLGFDLDERKISFLNKGRG